MQERPIADHALLGDTRTAALVTTDGSIDWMCVPAFEGPPVFGRLVDPEHGGSFVVAAVEPQRSRRRYRQDSAILETEMTTETGSGKRTEGMVVGVQDGLLPQLLLVRHVTCSAGLLRLRIHFDPRMGLPGKPPHTSRRAGATVCTWGSVAIAIRSEPDLRLYPGEETSIELPRGASFTSVLALSDRAPAVLVPPKRGAELLQKTDQWWRKWTADIGPEWPFRDDVVRSLITLRLLTFAPSGAPVASPTTSLPEVVGGSRNWDYRFSWVRDASIGASALLALGKGAMADAYLQWLLHASRLTRPRLEVLYTVYGTPTRDEVPSPGVSGYRGSRPVRTGNSAATQHQLDVYGWILHAGWSMHRHGRSLQGEVWRALRGFADVLAEVWPEPDSGIWESREPPQHYVHSKLMAWVGLGCALDLAEAYRVTRRRRARWSRARSALAAEIRERGYHHELGAYGRSFGSTDTDAALILLELFGFDDDPARISATLQTIRTALDADHGLLYRYPPETDGLDGKEGAFLPCSFWSVQALARCGDPAAARGLMEQVLGHANDVGLFSEEIAPDHKDLLGNFPLCFTHATLIQAAAALKEAEAR